MYIGFEKSREFYYPYWWNFKSDKFDFKDDNGSSIASYLESQRNSIKHKLYI